MAPGPEASKIPTHSLHHKDWEIKGFRVLGLWFRVFGLSVTRLSGDPQIREDKLNR